MCMSGGCGKKTGGGGSYTPKKSFFPKTKGASKANTSSRGNLGNSGQFGAPRVRLSFGKR